ncbi:DNA repair protein RadA [Candidatus Woesebacteria bacterium]|nr:DNA repair protein RadA [Candidatus Woesebacteria bacterium]
MSKKSSIFVCQNCAWSSLRWVGQCQSCNSWNTLVEEVSELSKSGKEITSDENIADFTTNLSQVDTLKSSKKRLSTFIDEFDRVLGGEDANRGMVNGAVMLIGGEPGIGKSTLLTQAVISMLAHAESSNFANKKIAYVCGEENPAQISMRISRLNEKDYDQDNLIFITSSNVDSVSKAIKKLKPSVVVVDSIQTLTTFDLTGSAGSVGQVRECAERLTTLAKSIDVPIFLVGHVTKEGTISGPKVLEHIVDAVLELSGDRTGDLRILRSVKNRFGATDEVGVFRMRDYGFESVTNPSELFLEYADGNVPGSATVCVMEGTRPLLVEIQALVVDSQLAMPRRVGRGLKLSRIQVLAAVLQKHCKLPLSSNDIFASVAGGFNVNEPALDLGLAIAMASSLVNKPINEKTVFIGEIGLLGEIRSVNLLDRRIKEAKRLGFNKVISKKTHSTVASVLKELKLIRSS